MGKKLEKKLNNIKLEMIENLTHNIKDIKSDLVGKIHYEDLGKNKDNFYKELNIRVSKNVLDSIFGKFIEKQFKIIRKIDKILNKLIKK